MDSFKEKAKRYFITGNFSERLGAFDVASTNYFKSLSAINDFILSNINLFPKDHNERFSLLKENFPRMYRLTSSLFLTYRKTYSKDISKEEMLMLKQRLKEAFKDAGIEFPTDSEIEVSIQKAHKK